MTTKRTLQSLSDLGFISEYVTVDKKILSKLLKKFSHNSIKFLNEIYKIITNNYFQYEPYSKYNYLIFFFV